MTFLCCVSLTVTLNHYTVKASNTIALFRTALCEYLCACVGWGVAIQEWPSRWRKYFRRSNCHSVLLFLTPWLQKWSVFVCLCILKKHFLKKLLCWIRPKVHADKHPVPHSGLPDASSMVTSKAWSQWALPLQFVSSKGGWLCTTSSQ